MSPPSGRDGRDIGRAERIVGRPALSPPPIELRAGPVRYLLDGIDVRHVREGDVELAERVYIAVRDAPWNTIPGVVSDRVVADGADESRVTFHVRHRHQDIDVEWDGLIEGGRDGTLRYTIDVVLHGVFRYSKIGCNVHHPLEGSVGRPFRARTSDGELRGVLPSSIDPQRIVDGSLSGMFAAYDELAIEVAPGIEAVTSIEGDLMELQDHRNWIDANLKSYATPLSLGFPFTSTDGQRVRQAITIRRAGAEPPARRVTDLTLRLGDVLGPAPRLGLGMRSDGTRLSASEVARLAALRPHHLRADLVLRGDAWVGALERAVIDARAVGAALELAVAANLESGPSLDRLADRLRGDPVPVDRVLVHGLADGFTAVVGATPPATVRLVADRLRPVLPGVRIAAGTDQSFADVNRDRPSDPAIEDICCSMSPTVHAADDTSVMENVPGVGEVVRSGRALRDGAPDGRGVVISPVTLATRFGPYPAGPAAPGDLPSAVDVRQASLFGAAWTVGALGALAMAGAASVTWYETAGWRGVVQGDQPPPMALFPSAAGEVFPVWHVLADLADWLSLPVRTLTSSDPMTVGGLAIETAAGPALLVANLTPVAQRVRLEGLRGSSVRVRILDDAAAAWALTDPDTFRALPGTPMPVRAGVTWVGLGPYAVARVVSAAT